MSIWPATHPRYPGLFTPEGELVSVRITVDPRLLEDLLEALAEVPFPINPEIFHLDPIVVEFPAYAGRLAELRAVLERSGFEPESTTTRDMLQEIRGA